MLLIAKQLQVGKDENSLTITGQREFSIYGVFVVAINEEGAQIKVLRGRQCDDHRPCCAQQGISATCLDLCSGDVSDLRDEVQVQTLTRLSVTLSGLEAGSQYQVMVSCLASGVGNDEVESSISEETLVMNTLIHNITREIIKMINVLRKPIGKAPLITFVVEGGTLKVECRVDAKSCSKVGNIPS